MNAFRRWVKTGMFAVFCLLPFCSEGQIWVRIIPEQNVTPELVPADQLPRNGTFWSIQRTNCPPLPFDPFPELPVYWINKERNVFLLDDRSVDHQALYQRRLAARMLEAAALGMSLEEMESMEGGGGGAAYDYSTNELWLEIISFTNSTAALVIHPPWNETNVVHDLFYSTNLASPTNWHFLMRATRTNILVPEMCDQQGFFRLGRTNGDLTVTTNVTPQQMAQLLVPPWVTVTNASFTGADVARGTFSGGHGCGLPLETGVILSSGEIFNAIGTNNDDGTLATGSYVGSDGDTNLDAVLGLIDATLDAAALEFDLASSNSFVLRFQYIFARKNTRNGSATITTRWRFLSAQTTLARIGSLIPPITLRWSRAPTCK